MAVKVTIHVFDNNRMVCVMRDVTLPTFPNRKDSIFLDGFVNRLEILDRIITEDSVSIYCDATKGHGFLKAGLVSRLHEDYGWTKHTKVENE